MRNVVSRFCVLGLAALLIPACGKSGGGGGHGASADQVPTFVVPGTGGRILQSNGGTGNAGAGGAGGAINLSSTSGSDLSVLAGDLTVDVGFVVPTFTPFLGTNPLTFLTPGPATLTPPLVPSPLLGNDGLTAATGLHVGPGVTLTIATNSPSPGLRTDVVLSFLHSVWIEGTLVTAHQDVTSPGDAASLSAAHLSITCSNYLGTKVSSIDTRGTGALVLEVGGNGGNVILRAQENLVNEGTIAASGGNAGPNALSGGRGGAVGLAAGDFLFSTGDITANGGTTLQPLAFGGAAGNIVLASSAPFAPATASWYSDCNVRGSLTARGGDGGAGGGAGAGGTNPLLGAPAGVWLFSSGNLGGNGIYDVAIDASGGNATSSGNGGNGSAAAPAGVRFITTSGSMRAQATVVNRGGNGAGGGNGGAGGSFSSGQGTNVGPSSFDPPALVGGMSLALSVDTGGGNGAVGGAGGGITILQPLNGLPPGLYPVILAGVERLESSGGQGTSQGGAASLIALHNFTHSDQFGNKALGGIRNEAELIANGGAATAGAGGAGASITLATDVPPIDNNDFGSTDRSVKNLADLFATGGNGTTTGGNGGAVKLFDHFKTINWGDVTTSGGATNIGTGGEAGSILVGADRFVTNFGDLTALGGPSGLGAGGLAGDITVATVKTFLETFGSVFGDEGMADNRGALHASGGNGGAAGGNGANIIVFDHFKAVNSGPLTASGGNGGSDGGGRAGAVWILSDVRATNDAKATANGGSATGGGNGAAGGSIVVVSLRSRQSGDCTAKGGNGAVGGDGGFIQVHSATPPSTVHGTMTVTQGTGGTPIVGAVVVDGIDQALTAGVVTFP